MSADGHLVTVVIPTLARPTLEDTRRALAGQTRPPDEVVVVVDTERRGASWARNEGIRRSHGDLIAFTDDDSIPPPDWLERHIGALDRHEAAAVGGAVREVDDLLRRKFERKRYPTEELLDAVGWVGNGANIMISRAWLDACFAATGFFFDRSLETGEDHELFHRLRRLGGKIVFVPNSVTHLRRVTPMRYFAFQFRRGRGIATLHRAIRLASGGGAIPQRGLLWGQGRPDGRAKWAAAFWKKAVGPFDLSSFAGPGQFAVFWIGEKLEGAGFLAELARCRFAGERGTAREPPA